MMKEEWKEIPNYDGRYQASNIGRLRALNFKRTGKEGILTPTKSHKGYLRVLLTKNGKVKSYPVHRLILAAFIGESKLLVDHINGVPDDNRIENLRYCTNRQNMSFNNVKWPTVKSSQFTGVYYEKCRNKFRANIKINNKSVHLGRFDKEEDAAHRYQTAIKEYGF